MEITIIIPEAADQDQAQLYYEGLMDSPLFNGTMIEQVRDSGADHRHLSGTGELINGIKIVGEHLWEPAVVAAICSLWKTHMQEKTKRGMIKLKYKNKKGDQLEYSGYTERPEELGKELKKQLDNK